VSDQVINNIMSMHNKSLWKRVFPVSHLHWHWKAVMNSQWKHLINTRISWPRRRKK